MLRSNFKSKGEVHSEGDSQPSYKCLNVLECFSQSLELERCEHFVVYPLAPNCMLISRGSLSILLALLYFIHLLKGTTHLSVDKYLQSSIDLQQVALLSVWDTAAYVALK